MRSSILLDATHYATSHPTGVELYVNELLPRLSRLLQTEGVSVEWIGHDSVPPRGMPEGVVWHYSAYQPFWSQRRLIKELARLKPTLYFTPSGITPIRTPARTSMMVHDLSVYSFPHAYTAGQRWRLTILSRTAARKAALLLAPSDYTQKEIYHRWRIQPEKVVVTPLAAFGKASTSESVTLDLAIPIILFIGRLESKKNLHVLLEAFNLLEAGSAQLVVAGPEGLGAAHLISYIHSLPEAIQKHIIRPGYIADAQKRWLHEHATIVVVPGGVEGFGLPLLEAFEYGVPALCANSGALPEVGGEAALYVETRDVFAWKEQLERLLTDSSLRASLVAAGNERLSHYTWDRTAQLTAQALLSAL